MAPCLSRCFLLLSGILSSQSFQYPFKVTHKPSMWVFQMKSRIDENEKTTKRRTPANKRQAIKWVVQGVERCLADQQLPSPPENGSIRFRKKNHNRVYTYKRREDASLVDALYLMVNAKNQKEVIYAGKRIEVLMRRGCHDFPVEVTERVVKATAEIGLVALSLDLLRHMLEDSFPSPIAYIAVINALRKNGRLSLIEELLTDLATSCRSHNKELKTGTREAVGVDIVAFNSFIAALCDAAVKDIPFSPASTQRGSTTDLESYDETLPAYSNSTEVSSSSQKLISKALDLLRADTARKRFALSDDPDVYSFNSVLSAAAKCSRSVSKDFTKYVIESCLRSMKLRAVEADSFTYNARIQAELGFSKQYIQKESKAIQIIDEAFSKKKFDRYTINLAIIPLLQDGRLHELMPMMRSFYMSNANNGKLVSSAFEAFLNTLVQNSELDFANSVFEEFFLSSRYPSNRSPNRFQMSQEIHVVTNGSWVNNQFGNGVKTSSIEPTTRHFNILLSGYSKMYRPSRSYGNTSNISEDVSVSIASKVYGLLDVMVRIGVPLDKYSVSCLMKFPTSSEEITLLWKR